jgi:hypothetical protein
VICRSQRLLPQRLPSLRRAAASGGYMLPLACTGSLLLLLGSLSVQTVTLQERQRAASIRELRRAEDDLASVAQHLVGELQRRHPCLLPLPLSAWASAADGCGEAGTLAALQRGEVIGVPYQLIAWQPERSPQGQSAVTLVIERLPQPGDPPRRAAFSLALAGEPAHAEGLWSLGLRGVAP